MKSIFISYARENKTFAERLAKDLQDAGFDIWVDFGKIGIGEMWRNAIFRGIEQSDLMIVCLSPAAVESEWVRREILMARSQSKQIIPVMAIACYDAMKDHDETRYLEEIQIVDFEQLGYEKAFPFLLKSLLVLKGIVSTEHSALDPASIPNPFKGLEAFQEADATFFFGRDALLQKLLARLKANTSDRFLAVVGASGSGKSSLIRAGMIPAIRAGKLPGSEEWKIVIFTPGSRPTEALAKRLLPLIGTPHVLNEIVNILEQRSDALHQLIEGLLPDTHPQIRFVLVVDQFEEVFTRASGSEAARFLDLLNTAVTLDGGRTLGVITMRADFFDHLSAYPGIAALVERENMIITTDMNLDGLQQSIENPAHVVGLAYEQGLTARILDDVRQQPGSLPLLQFALKELYEQRNGRWLTISAFEAMGGVKGALAQHAENIFSNLDTTRQAILRRLLLRLIEVSETGEVTRRRVKRNDLTFVGLPQNAVEQVINQLTAPETRLLVANREIAADEGSELTVWVEISHEALTYEWKRLQTWISQEESTLRLGSELLKVAQDWQKAGQSTDYLLTGTRLSQALVWLNTADASDLQRNFINSSEKYFETLRERDEARQAHELILQRKAAERLRYLATALMLFLIAAAGLSIYAFNQRNTAQMQAQNAVTQAALAANNATKAANALYISENRGTEVAQQAATSAANLLNADWTQGLFLADLSRQQLETGWTHNALLLALDSLEKTYGLYGKYPIESASALLNVLNISGQEIGYMKHADAVGGAAWNADENQILSWAADSVEVWDAQTSKSLLTLRHADAVGGASWSADGSRILSWSDDGSVRVWDAQTGSSLLTLRHTDRVYRAAWNADESQILSWSRDGNVQVWDAQTGAPLLILAHEEIINGFAWNADESQILSWSDDGNVQVWDAQTGSSLLTLPHTGAVGEAAWNADESQILSWSDDGNVQVWDAQTGSSLLTLRHTEVVGGAAWNADESQILSWADNSVEVWDAQTGALLLTLRHTEVVGGATWIIDGTQILSWAYDGSIQLWDAQTGSSLLALNGNQNIDGILWNSDTSQILSWSFDGKLEIWDTQTNSVQFTLSHSEMIYGVTWSQEGNQILSWSRDGSVRVWNIDLDATLLTLYQRGSVYEAVWNADESQILSWSRDGNVQVWDAQMGALLLTLPHTDRVYGAAWNADESQILSWSRDGNVQVWDAQTGASLLTLPHTGAVGEAAWNADESQILSWSDDGNVQVWDAQTGVLLLTLPHTGAVDWATWNADESQILSWSRDGNVQVWDAQTGTPLLTLRHIGTVDGAAWNADESQILSWAGDSVQVWDAQTGALLLTLDALEEFYGAAWNVDGGRILSWAGDSVQVWDAQTGALLLTLRHEDSVYSASWSADGSRILSWSDDGNVQVWDGQTGALLLILTHREIIDHAMWNMDETQILSWTFDDRIWVWDAQTGIAIITFPNKNSINGASWSADGSRILSWYNDGSIRVWDTSIDYYIQLGQQQKIRGYDNIQGQQFFLPTHTPSPTLDVRIASPTSTITPLPTLTPSPTPTLTSTPAPRIAQLGENRGDLLVGTRDIWIYEGHANEVIAITVLADKPGSATNPDRWVEEGKFDSKLTVFDINGNMLAENDDLDPIMTNSGGVTNTDSQITLRLLYDGIYTFHITSAWGGLTGGKYTLTIEQGVLITPIPTP